MAHPTVTLFTKPNCPYCTRAKAVLQQASAQYTEHDVTASSRAAAAAVYFSGRATVPQIFIGRHHVNGAEDLERLQQSQRLGMLLNQADKPLLIDEPPDAVLQQGAEDWALRHAIPQSDGSRSDNPEDWPILRFYKQFFGFWPNTFAYLNHWLEAYRLFVYCHNFSAVGYGKQGLGPLNMFAVGYATSNAHGCSYCQIHSAATGGEASLRAVQQFKEARSGEAGDGNPFGPLELAIADLAAKATTNTVTSAQIRQIQALAPDSQTAAQSIEGVKMMVAAFGFLNVFNDLAGLQIEGQWAKQASAQSGIEAGRHEAEASNPNNLDYDLPTGGPTIEQMLAQYQGAIADLPAYAQREFGLLPAWMQRWPQPLQKHHAYLYGELMGEREHTLLPSELKHLMARVSAIAKDHGYLAAVEGYMAHHQATDKARTVERIRHCYAAATGSNRADLFSLQEQSALQFAWISAQTPLTTPRRYVASAVEQHSPQALIHLMGVCAIASMVQRFVAIAQPLQEESVTQFLCQYGLAADPLTLRYPMLDETYQTV